jgi:DedD protein
MAFFQMRKGGDEPQATSRQPESIEAMRRRAKHRLIGASVLVLIAVIGFPLLFDTQPRPINVDIPIEIPDRNKVKPLPMPAPAPQAAPAVTQAPRASAPAPAPSASVAKVETPAPPPPPASSPAAHSDDGTKALAILEGKPLANTPVEGEGRFVVQVGAFADASKARETRLKVEHAGLKTYTQVVETKEGKRIRVRVGPFVNKVDAEKAADKVKGLDLPASVLTL